jgi:deoxyribonuclease-1
MFINKEHKLKKIILILSLIIPLLATAQIPKNFHQARAIVYKDIFKDHKETFYCGCEYDNKGKIDTEGCYTPKANKKGKFSKRAFKTEVEHVVPASTNNFLQCWREPEKFPVCINKKGKVGTGRACCNKIKNEEGDLYRKMSSDLHNLVPAIGQVNQYRSNYKFGVIEGEDHMFPKCDFEIAKINKKKVVEPTESIRGDIARTYLYMSECYGFKISKQQRQLFQAWNKIDPVSKWEKLKNDRIKLKQGNSNHYIDGLSKNCR